MPDGKLAVPGAEAALPAMARLVGAARVRPAFRTSRPPTTTS